MVCLSLLGQMKGQYSVLTLSAPASKCPQEPHSHILMTGGGRRRTRDFLGSEILAQSDLLGL